MSISNIRKLIEHKAVSIGCFSLLFVGFAVSFLSQGPSCKNSQGANNQALEANSVAVVGNYHATAHEIDLAVDQDRAQVQGNFDTANEANSYAQALQKALNNGLTMVLAERNGVAPTDDNAEQALPSMAAQALQEFREQLVSQGKLKPNATEAEFAQQFQLAAGQSPDQARENLIQRFKDGLKDPSRHDTILAQIAQMNLLNKFLSQTTVTDEDLKRSYSTFNLQKIDFKGPDALTKAQQAAAEAKSGTSFEKVAAKYAPDQVKSLSMTMPGMYFSIIPTYAPIKSLKVGEVSDPIDTGGGQTIFKLVSLTNPKLPPDFEKQKDQLRKQQQQQTATMKLNAALEDLQKSEQIQWKSPAYEALYEFQQAQNDLKLDPAQKKEKIKGVADKAAAALQSDANNSRVAALAEFAAVSFLYDSATPAEKKTMAPQRIKAIQDVLVSSENPRLRIELSDLLMDAGNHDEAVNQLRTAAESNNDLGAEGQGLYSTIQGKLEQYKKDKKVNDQEAAAIQKELDRWRDDKKEQDRMEAETKKQQEEDKKKLDAENAAAEAAAKKDAKPANPGAPAAKPPAATPAAPTKK